MKQLEDACSQAHRVAHDLVLERLDGVERAHADVARDTHSVRRGTEQALEAVHGERHADVRALAVVLVLHQKVLARQVLAALDTVHEQVAQRLHVREPQVQSLTRERVDRVRRVADQRDTWLHVGRRVLHLEWERHALADDLSRARWCHERIRERSRGHDGVHRVAHTLDEVREHRQTWELWRHWRARWRRERFVQARDKVFRRELLELLGFVRRGGPHDRAVAVAHRQQRDRTGWEETLPRRLVWHVGLDGRDDRLLVVLPAPRAERRQRAHDRVAAVGSDHQVRLDARAVREADLRERRHGAWTLEVLQVRWAVELERLRVRRGRRELVHAVVQRAHEHLVLHDVAQVLLASLRGVEADEAVAHGVPHLHVLERRLLARVDLVPDLGALKERLRRRGDREHAEIWRVLFDGAHWRRRVRRLDHGDALALEHRVGLQLARERRANDATANDEHIVVGHVGLRGRGGGRISGGEAHSGDAALGREQGALSADGGGTEHHREQRGRG